MSRKSAAGWSGLKAQMPPPLSPLVAEGTVWPPQQTRLAQPRMPYAQAHYGGKYWIETSELDGASSGRFVQRKKKK